ncbi:hypothetical protein EJB05_23301 [Eragrostis curvula]|uniref:Uncharacterized protein n=1 Tax=Eragrostis curvula TaxID=38414 RepID=A0A5J9V6R1_9POAL|nr:hypothetical protein EJB05_23301 [Eragrostis curvula]
MSPSSSALPPPRNAPAPPRRCSSASSERIMSLPPWCRVANLGSSSAPCLFCGGEVKGEAKERRSSAAPATRRLRRTRKKRRRKGRQFCGCGAEHGGAPAPPIHRAHPAEEPHLNTTVAAPICLSLTSPPAPSLNDGKLKFQVLYPRRTPRELQSSVAALLLPDGSLTASVHPIAPPLSLLDYKIAYTAQQFAALFTAP